MNTRAIIDFLIIVARRNFWVVLFRAFDAFERWQEKWPKPFRIETKWETKLWFWLLTRGG